MLIFRAEPAPTPVAPLAPPSPEPGVREPDRSRTDATTIRSSMDDDDLANPWADLFR